MIVASNIESEECGDEAQIIGDINCIDGESQMTKEDECTTLWVKAESIE